MDANKQKKPVNQHQAAKPKVAPIKPKAPAADVKPVPPPATAVKVPDVKPVNIPAAAPVAPVPVSPPPPAAPTKEIAQTDAAPAPKKHRTQVTDAADIKISAARTRRHIDKLNINHCINEPIDAIRGQLDEHKKLSEIDVGTLDAAGAEELKKKLAAIDVPALESKLAALTHERVRFSNTAPVVLSIICDELVREIAQHAMENVIAHKKKIIHIEHLHTPGIENISLYPLIKSLPSFAAKSEEHEKIRRQVEVDKEINIALTKVKKQLRKKFGRDVDQYFAGDEKSGPKEPVEKPAPEEAQSDDDDGVDHKTSFKFYVNQICKSLVAENEKYKPIRISSEIKSYLSDLVVEFIKRVSPLVYLTTKSMKNKTANDAVILRVVEMLLVDSKPFKESIEFLEVEIPDPKILATAKTDKSIDKKNIAKIKAYQANRKLSYGSGYTELLQQVEHKLELYKSDPSQADAEEEN